MLNLGAVYFFLGKKAGIEIFSKTAILVTSTILGNP